MFAKRSLTVLGLSAVLAACGGGGGSDNTGTEDTKTPTREVKKINANQAIVKLILTDYTWSDMDSNDSYLTTATLFARGQTTNSRFITSTSNTLSSFEREFQLQLHKYNGTRGSQYIWKIIFDKDGNPLGAAATQELFDWDNTSCIEKVFSDTIPTLSNENGILFSGNSGAYNQNFAQYCNATIPIVSKDIEWSVADGDPNPYICLTFPAMSWNPKTRICLSSDIDGNLTGAPWVRTYLSDGTPATDYKKVDKNKPYEYFSSVINPANYWYGVVWRPSDGYIYQEYTNVKFSSELACRNQTQVNWRETWKAVNQTWSCVNIMTHK